MYFPLFFDLVFAILLFLSFSDAAPTAVIRGIDEDIVGGPENLKLVYTLIGFAVFLVVLVPGLLIYTHFKRRPAGTSV